MEALEITPKIKELIMAKVAEVQVKRAARLEGMKTLRENGLAKALKGMSSVEEVLRITAADEELE